MGLFGVFLPPSHGSLGASCWSVGLSPCFLLVPHRVLSAFFWCVSGSFFVPHKVFFVLSSGVSLALSLCSVPACGCAMNVKMLL